MFSRIDMTDLRCGFPSPSLTVLAVVGACLTALASGLYAAADADNRLPENPIEGRVLFESKHCNRCHGLGQGGPDVGPALGGGHFSGKFFDLGAALWNHVPNMSVAFEELDLSWPALSPDEARLLMGFMYYIDYLGQPGAASAGRRVFFERGCSSCHRIGSEGREVGPDLTQLNRYASPLFIARAVWNHGPAMIEAMQDRHMQPPEFRPGDLANLSAYIRSVGAHSAQQSQLLAPGNPKQGREYFLSRGCGDCHSPRSGAGRGAPNLLDRPLPRSAEAIAGTMWNHATAMGDEMRRRNIAWPQFTTQEFADLISYLYFLPFADAPGRATRGAEIFAARSCAECHASGPASPHPGPDLLVGKVTDSPEALVSAMWNHAPVMKEAVLSEGRPWPELTGDDLRDLFAYLQQRAASP